MNASQKLGDQFEMSNLQVVEVRERLVEVLSQEEHLLRDVEDFAFLHLTLLDESFHNCWTDKFLSFKLLANFECDIDGANSEQGWLSTAEFMIMHGHLRQIYRHFLNQVVLCPRLLVKIAFIGFYGVKSVTFDFLLLWFWSCLLWLACLALLLFLHEAQCPLLLFLGFSAVLDLYTEHLNQEVAQEVEYRRCVHLVLNSLEDVDLLLLNLFNWYLFLRYLLVYRLHSKGANVLEFGSDEQRGNSDDVKLGYWQTLLAGLEVAIHQWHSREESLITAGEVGQHFDDPVDHASAHWSSDVVPVEAVGSVVLKFFLAKVALDVGAELRPDVDVLSLHVAGTCSRQVPAWMLLAIIIVFHHVVLCCWNLPAAWIHGGRHRRRWCLHRGWSGSTRVLARGMTLAGSHLADDASVEEIVVYFSGSFRHLLGFHAGAGWSSNSQRCSKWRLAVGVPAIELR